MEDSNDGGSPFFCTIPLNYFVIIVEYLVVCGLCVLQSVRIVKNHHKFCGVQNLVIMFCCCWCVFRVLDLVLEEIIEVVAADNGLAAQTVDCIRYIASDIPSFVMVFLLSLVVYYLTRLIHADAMKHRTTSLTVAIITVFFNVFYIATVSVIDVVLISITATSSDPELDRDLFSLIYALSALVYLVVSCALGYVAVRIFFINRFQLPQSHPSPRRMGVFSTIITICTITRFLFDLVSACLQATPRTKIMHDIFHTTACAETPTYAVVLFGLNEIFLMTLWEIIPLASLLIMFWSIPSIKKYTPFSHLEINEEDDDDEHTPLLV